MRTFFLSLISVFLSIQKKALMDYDFLQIEKKWQDIWSTKKTFKADNLGQTQVLYIGYVSIPLWGRSPCRAP